MLWRVKTMEKSIYLTFDDGPVPEATPWVLDQLKEYQAMASFFMVGDNVKKYPMVYESVVKAGHTVANHTFNHVKGWSTTPEDYLENIILADNVLQHGGQSYFRPPYGQISRSQYKLLKDQRKIVMWDVLAGDFDKNISAETCLRKTIKYTRPGSIVLFHDSIKTISLVKQVLPKYLEHFTNLGYKFLAL